MRKLFGTVLLAAAFAGCGESPEPAAPPAATPAATEATAEREHELDLSGYSEGVKAYYGGAHTHSDDEWGSGEAEYHQPPMPPETTMDGGTIELTGTEIGVRFKVTVEKVRPVGDHMAVYLKLVSTGVTVYDRPIEMATVTYPGEEPTPLDTEASAKCSNGFDDILRIDVSRTRRGCLLFPRSGDKLPERFQLALEVVPVDAGGIWKLN